MKAPILGVVVLGAVASAAQAQTTTELDYQFNAMLGTSAYMPTGYSCPSFTGAGTCFALPMKTQFTSQTHDA